jgi:hypothetical protein
MKTAALVGLASILSAVALAQSRDDVEKHWVAFTMLAHAADRAPIYLEEAGIGQEAALRISSYAAEGIKALNHLALDQRKQICGRADEMKASRSEYANTLERADAQWNVARRKLLAGVDSVLSAEDRVKYWDWVSMQRSPKRVGNSDQVRNQIRSGEMDHLAAIARFCREPQ